MKLKNLFKNISVEIKGFKDVEILAISNDSRKMFPRSLFIAKKGKKFDGNQFIEKAIEAGAVAVLSDLYNPFLPKNIVQVIHENVQKIEADIADIFYEEPSKKLLTIGVTGTKGKTTTTYLIKHLMDFFAKPCGLIGTIETIVKNHHYGASRTTPDSVSLQKMLKEMVNADCKAAVMEVSSHALDQERVKHIVYSQAILTNIASDHLDYHKTHENYLEAKKKLFYSLSSSSVAILNRDDCYFEEFSKASQHIKILTYGIDHPDAEVRATRFKLLADKTEITLSYQKESVEVFSPLVGRFNIYNFLAAASSAIAEKFSLLEIKKAFESFSLVQGRMERVLLPKQNFHVIIDYAHTEDSLFQVLKTLSEFKEKSRIITLFGCGGDRDRTKRPKMGAVSEKFSDYVVLTSDNPRSEDPQKICEEIASGFSENFSPKYQIISDRYQAIQKALSLAKPGDLVLIAGKGHEKIQEFASFSVPFDDRKVVEEICQ